MAVDFLPRVPGCLLAFLPDVLPNIISIQLSLQVNFISEEQKLAAVFVIEEFAIQRMYCVDHELLKVGERIQGARITSCAVRELLYKYLLKDVGVLPRYLCKTCICLQIFW